MPSPDLGFQNFSTAQGSQNAKPGTIASAATIAPTGFITFVTGTVAVVNITPPLEGQHMIVLIYTNAAPVATTAAGNIKRIATPVQNIPLILLWNPNEQKYYPMVGA